MSTESGFVDFRCPHCGDSASFPQADVGAVRECPACFESLIVPAEGSSDGRKIPLPFPAGKLALRRFTAGDWKDLLELLAQDEVFHYSEMAPLDEDGVLAWLERDRFVRFTTPDQPIFLGIELPEAGKLIGFAVLNFTDPLRMQVSLQIFLGLAHQRQGFGRETLKSLLQFCFEGLGLHRVTAQSDTRNLAACGLCAAAGLRKEGEFVKDRLTHGEWASTAVYALLKEEGRA
jgi:RimJ/RimL family protein N-acetyltransferase